jgi:hypothetical protein
MFKKIILTLTLFLFTFTTMPSYAQEITPVISLSPTPVVFSYSLPYPGLLPGHPLYFLKSLRDKLWGAMISNALKKAEFDLLQADKAIAAADLLYKQKAESKVILSVLNDARVYFDEAIVKSIAADKQGMDSSDLVKRLLVANRKHQEVVRELTKTTNDADSKQYLSELEKFKELEKKTSKLNSQ